MPISFACYCGKKLKAKEEYAGRTFRCPFCRSELVVPRPDAADGYALEPVPEPPPRPVAPVASRAAVPHHAPAAQPAATPAPVRVERPVVEVASSAPATEAVGGVVLAQTITVKAPKSVSAMGIASLVLGILAVLVCWVPLLGVVAIPVGLLGALLGGVGLLVSLLGRRSSLGFPAAGVIVCSLAIGVAYAVTDAIVSAIDHAMPEAVETNQRVVAPGDEDGPAPQPAGPGAALAGPGAALGGGPAPAAEPEWAPADRPVRQGDVEVAIESAAVSAVRLRGLIGGESGESQDPQLVVAVGIRNVGDTRKVDYRTWQGADVSFTRDHATLTDNFGNTYRRVSFGASRPDGQVEAGSIYPGKALRDVLVFEPPIDKAEHLDLELPAANFGGGGMLRIRIPMRMIARGR